jgi:hypothetical protein
MKFILFSFLFFIEFVSFSQTIVDFRFAPCDSKSNTEFIHRNYLVSKSFENDTLFIRLGLVRNCSFEPEIHLSQREDSLIFELKNKANEFTACTCCYELEIAITEIQGIDFKLYLKENETVFTRDGILDEEFYSRVNSKKYIFPSLSEIELLSINNHSNTDQLKTKTWQLFYENTAKPKIKGVNSIDENGISEPIWYVKFNEQGEMTEVCGTKQENTSNQKVTLCMEKAEYLKLDLK